MGRNRRGPVAALVLSAVVAAGVTAAAPHLAAKPAAPAGTIAEAGTTAEAGLGDAVGPTAISYLTFIVKHSGQCMDSLDPDGPVVQNHCKASLVRQQWYPQPVGDHYQLRNADTGECLSVPNASMNTAADLHTLPCLGQPHQLVRAAPGDSGHVLLILKHSGQCVEVASGLQEVHTQLEQDTCSGGKNQQWADGVEAIYKHVQARHSGKCLTRLPTLVGQYTCSELSIVEQWRLVEAGGGHYKLVIAETGKCLKIADGSLANGANAVMAPCDTTFSQQFKLVPTNSGYNQLMARHSRLCLEVDNQSLANFAQVQQNVCSTNTSRQWRIV